jgi:hypothetical protein
MLGCHRPAVIDPTDPAYSEIRADLVAAVEDARTVGRVVTGASDQWRVNSMGAAVQHALRLLLLSVGVATAVVLAASACSHDPEDGHLELSGGWGQEVCMPGDGEGDGTVQIFIGLADVRNPTKANTTLRGVQAEMNRRYEHLAGIGKRKITRDDGMPAVLLVIDELAYSSVTVGTKPHRKSSSRWCVTWSRGVVLPGSS